MPCTNCANQSPNEINPVTQAVQRCLEAYYHVLESNPKPPGPDVYREDYNEFKIEQSAQKAFLRNMPFLDSWDHVLCGLACIQHAIILGIIPRVDAGRHIHLLQLAISAYRPKPEPRAVGRPRIITPLPPLGDLAAPFFAVPASTVLPSEEAQAQLKEELKRMGDELAAAGETSLPPGIFHALQSAARAYAKVSSPKAPQSEPKAGPTSQPAGQTGAKAAA
jgi:hypothetical protein